MSLDIALLGADGSPKKQASIGVNDHYRLMGLLKLDVAPLLKRMNDYYTEANYENSELDGLLDEIRGARILCQSDDGLVSFLTTFSELVEEAKKERVALFVIPD